MCCRQSDFYFPMVLQAVAIPNATKTPQGPPPPAARSAGISRPSASTRYRECFNSRHKSKSGSHATRTVESHKPLRSPARLSTFPRSRRSRRHNPVSSIRLAIIQTSATMKISSLTIRWAITATTATTAASAASVTCKTAARRISRCCG